jgi:peptide chain release factor subunit 1
VPCPVCGGTAPSIVSKEDYVESLFLQAQAGGAGVRMVSTDSEEGEMLAKAFGGVAAILRYPLPAVAKATASSPL